MKLESNGLVEQIRPRTCEEIRGRKACEWAEGRDRESSSKNMNHYINDREVVDLATLTNVPV